jgi:CIC family chloride channel protein
LGAAPGGRAGRSAQRAPGLLLAPEAEGHGTDAAIEAFSWKAGQIRARIPPVKLIASAITIGSGGSAGREGPTAQISAGFGSLLSDVLKLEPNERRILVAVGIGAGIGAIFRAPLGGALLAAEILYLRDLKVEALLPGLITSIIGYSVFGIWAGCHPIFGTQPALGFTNPLELVYYALLGLICGAIGILYAKVFYGTTGIFQRRVPLPRWAKPAIGGLLVGLLGLAIPGVISTGYGWLQLGMSDQLLLLPPSG